MALYCQQQINDPFIFTLIHLQKIKFSASSTDWIATFFSL